MKKVRQDLGHQVLPKYCFWLKWLCYFQLVPYKWSCVQFEFIVSQGNRRIIIWVLAALTVQITHVLLLCNTMFRRILVLEECLKESKLKKAKLSNILALASNMSVQIMILACMSCYALNAKRIAILINRILWIHRSRRGARNRIKDVGIVVTIPKVLLFRAVQAILVAIVHHGKPRSLYSMLPEWMHGPVILPIYAVLLLWNSCSWMSITLVLGLPSLLLTTAKDVLKELSECNNVRSKVLHLRKLQVLKNDFDMTLAPVLLPAIRFYGTLAPIYAIFCIIWLFGRVDGSVILGSLTSLITLACMNYIMYSTGGKLKVLSKSEVTKVFHTTELESLQTQSFVAANLIRAYKQSCAHLSGRAGWAGKIKRAKFLTLVSYIFIHAARLLIIATKYEHS